MGSDGAERPAEMMSVVPSEICITRVKGFLAWKKRIGGRGLPGGNQVG